MSPSAVDVSGSAFLGCQALILASAMPPTPPANLAFATRFRNATRSRHAAELCRELKKLMAFALGLQLGEMFGTSWEALVLGKDPSNRGQGTPLVEAGATGTAPESRGPPTQGVQQGQPDKQTNRETDR